MQRQQLQYLQNWIVSKNRKPPVIRGARQVGKTTLVELFAKTLSIPLLNVNLKRHPELSNAFIGKNPEQILHQIESLPLMPKMSNNVLLFLDEIQSLPEANPSLRYFHEDYSALPLISADYALTTLSAVCLRLLLFSLKLVVLVMSATCIIQL